MNAWLYAFAATFAVGVITLATLPPVDSGPQVAAGWLVLVASFVLLARGLPEDA